MRACLASRLRCAHWEELFLCTRARGDVIWTRDARERACGRQQRWILLRHAVSRAVARERAREGARRTRRRFTFAGTETSMDVITRAHVDTTRVNARDDARNRPMRVNIATAGVMSSGKTALIRRFFAEARAAASDCRDAVVDDWRATPTIGMDFGTMRIEYCENDLIVTTDDGGTELSRSPKVVRGCFFDPSGADAHAPCRREAYRDADGVILVIDATRRGSQAELEFIIREIASAPRADEANSVPIHVLVVRAKTRSAPSRAALRSPSASTMPLQDDDSELALLRHRLHVISTTFAHRAPPHGANRAGDIPIRFVPDASASSSSRDASSARAPLADILVIDTDAASGAGVTRAVQTLTAHIAREKSSKVRAHRA